MKKFLTALLLFTAGVLPASAENWISLPGSDSAAVDTDSFVDSGLRAGLDIKLALDGDAVISSMEFDKERRTYRVAAVKTLAADGSVKGNTTYSDDAGSWNALQPNSFGRNVYNHFVENPIPHFKNPEWMPIYKEEGIKFHGSTYDIEKHTISYKNGYATFYLRIAYPWEDQNFSQVIYQVRMDVPNKRVQTLSMTEYDLQGKIKNHGAGGNDRTPIASDTPMEKIHTYIQREVESGRL